MIGANPKSIELAENRQKFKEAMREINLLCPKSIIVKNIDQAFDVKKELESTTCNQTKLYLGRNRWRSCL